MKIEILLKSNGIINIMQNLYFFSIFSHKIRKISYDLSYTFVLETNSDIDGYNLQQYL